MITIERIYYPEKEYKLLSQALRYMSKQDCYKYHKDHLEKDLTELIDDFLYRWNYQKMLKDTIRKLYKYAIAYRYRVVQGIE